MNSADVQKMIEAAASNDGSAVTRWAQAAVGVSLRGHPRHADYIRRHPERAGGAGMIRVEYRVPASHDDDDLSVTGTYLRPSDTSHIVACEISLRATDNGSPDIEHAMRDGGPLLAALRRARV